MTKINNSYICAFHYTRDICVLCRDCDGKNQLCEDYVPQLQKILKKNEDVIRRTEIIIRNSNPIRLKILPRNYQDWIRRYNDNGVI